MRLLRRRPDHGGGGALEREAEADRRRHRRGDDQHLPLRHLPAHPRGDPQRGQWWQAWRQAGQGRVRQRPQGLRGRRAMREITSLNRRFFISSAAVAGGLALGWKLPGGLLEAEAQTKVGNDVGIWVEIYGDDTTVVRIARSEMGQGTLTGLAQLVADELECNWSKVKAEYVKP